MSLKEFPLFVESNKSFVFHNFLLHNVYEHRLIVTNVDAKFSK